MNERNYRTKTKQTNWMWFTYHVRLVQAALVPFLYTGRVSSLLSGYQMPRKHQARTRCIFHQTSYSKEI